MAALRSGTDVRGLAGSRRGGRGPAAGGESAAERDLSSLTASLGLGGGGTEVRGLAWWQRESRGGAPHAGGAAQPPHGPWKCVALRDKGLVCMLRPQAPDRDAGGLAGSLGLLALQQEGPAAAQQGGGLLGAPAGAARNPGGRLAGAACGQTLLLGATCGQTLLLGATCGQTLLLGAACGQTLRGVARRRDRAGALGGSARADSAAAAPTAVARATQAPRGPARTPKRAGKPVMARRLVLMRLVPWAREPQRG
jgi:hypothetical protein